MTTSELDFKYVQIYVPIRKEEDVPLYSPFRSGNKVETVSEGNDWLRLTIEISTGKIPDWPVGQSGELHIKVVDNGTYNLLDKNKTLLVSLQDEYVPNHLIPGDYGDYIVLHVNITGEVTNWYKNPRFDEFPGYEEID